MAKKSTTSMDSYRGVDMGKLAKISGYATDRGQSEWVKFEDNEPLLLRFLPIHMVFPDLEVPGVEHVTHAKEPYPSSNPNWKIGDYSRQITCLRAHTEDTECPICKLGEYLEEEGEQDSNLYKGILPSKRILFNVVEIDPKSGKGTIKILGMRGSVFTSFKKLIARVGDVFDPKKGFNLVITREKEGRGPTRYTVSTDPEGRTPLSAIKGIDNWQKQCRNPEEFISVMEPQEILAVLLENLPDQPISEIFDLRVRKGKAAQTDKKTTKKGATKKTAKPTRGSAAVEVDAEKEEEAPPRRSARSVVKKTARRGR